MDASVVVDGEPSEADLLWDWLRDQPSLRGYLSRRISPPPPGTMSAGEVVMVVTSVAPMIGALAQTLTAYLVQRAREGSTEVSMKISLEARTVTFDAKTATAADGERLLRAGMELAAKELAADAERHV
ncbi:hypothetical protein FHX75_111267 [Micromonospora palomenae]|uniref:Uncharacterized protein n=2 Tax=Micromonospora palomenae TaxID=1461247 RepID=A0A561WW65_9ACTN|nr:hypothetical protein FHX75_111267 [Micromonospora palomenae]